MFYSLILVTFALALGISYVVMHLFSSSIYAILARIIQEPIHTAWGKYTFFAGLVVGTSSGIRIYDIEKYISPIHYDSQSDQPIIIQLTQQRWVLEIYRTMVETLQGLAWMMLVFFMVALLAYVLIKRNEATKH